MKTYISLTAPYHWVTLDKNGNVEASGVVDALQDFSPPKSAQICGVVPGHAVVIHHVTIPARSRNKIIAAVPYALEDQLATDVEELFFAILDRDQTAQVRVAVIERKQILEWIGAANDLRRPLDAMVPDYFLLPLHPQAEFTVANAEDEKIYVRGKNGWGACLDQDSLDLWWQELGNANAALAVNDVDMARALVKQGGNLISQWDIGHSFPQWLRFSANENTSSVNLLQGEYAPQHHGSGNSYYKVAAGLLIVALLSRGLYDGYEFLSLRNTSHALQQAMTATFKKAFPNARIQEAVNLRADMESRLHRLQTGAGIGEFQLLLSAIAKAIQVTGSSKINLESIDYRKRELVVTCVTDSFDMLNRLKATLEKVSYVDAELTSSSSLENKVTGKFSVRSKS